MTVGERLRSLRKIIGLSQQELSDRVGLKRDRYARYETDDNQADYETLINLANFFSVTIDYLLGNTNDPHQTKNISEDAPEKEEVHFAEWDNLTEEQKEKVYDYIRYLRWEAEQYNQRNDEEKIKRGSTNGDS